jgi:hypothetical protein
VLQHKSSKEIARTLGISPYTVDQRIAAARQKLNVCTRGELARAYAELLEICGQTAYDFPHIAIDGESDQSDRRDLQLDPVIALSDVATLTMLPPWQAQTGSSAGLEALDRRFGIFGRVLAVFGLAAFIALMFLAMVAIAQTLTKIV